jgi:hypothetical protein
MGDRPVRTPNGGQRDTQWVIQYRQEPATETALTGWTRYQTSGNPSGPQVRLILEQLREGAPDYQWRAIRLETVQRVEDW